MQTLNIRCGLVISTTHLWLAATSNGWVLDPLAVPSCGLVEFKTHIATMILQLMTPFRKIDAQIINGTVLLKLSHNYYYQDQFVIFCTNTKCCDFHYYTLVDTIEHCMSILPKLKILFMCSFI